MMLGDEANLRYRTSIVRDSEAVLILADLFRSGSRSEEDISTHANINIHRVRQKLGELYRNSLVEMRPDERWIVTHSAGRTLSRMGIADIVARSLLKEQPLAEAEISFLEACTMLRAASDDEWPIYQTAFLRVLNLAGERSLVNLGRGRDEIRRVLYGAVVGLDPLAHQLGGENYFKHVMDWHIRSGTDHGIIWREEWLRSMKHHERQCGFGVRLAVDSNRLLMFPDSRGTLRKSRASRLTLLRVVCSLTSEMPDPALGSLDRLGIGSSFDHWSKLIGSLPDGGKAVRELLPVLVETDGRTSDFLGRLNTNGLYNRPTRLSLFPETEEESLISSSPTRGAYLKVTLMKLKEQIEHGSYDGLAEEERVSILKLLAAVVASFHERIEGQDPFLISMRSFLDLTKMDSREEMELLGVLLKRVISPARKVSLAAVLSAEGQQEGVISLLDFLRDRTSIENPELLDTAFAACIVHFAKVGNYREGISVLSEILTGMRASTLPRRQFASTCNQLGKLMHIAGRFGEARELFEEALRLMPGKPEYIVNLASNSRAQGAHSRARAELAMILGEEGAEGSDERLNTIVRRLEERGDPPENDYKRKGN